MTARDHGAILRRVTIVLGGVPYGVGAPLLAGLDREPGCRLVQEPPTKLVELLRRGELDAALVSSIEAVRTPGYRVFAGLGIAAKHEVRSVRAFRRRGRKVASVGLDRSSATSVALLQLLLRHPRAADCAATLQFESIAPVREPAALPHDLVLLIGDLGLAADGQDREIWDLATEWRRWTGLPFVFAVWLLRPGADVARLAPLLHGARTRGRALGAVDGTHGAVHYELDAEDLRGLRRFWDLARAAELAPAGHEATFAGA